MTINPHRPEKVEDHTVCESCRVLWPCFGWGTDEEVKRKRAERKAKRNAKPQEPIAETVRIRHKSLPHVETERLVRRYFHIRDGDHSQWLERLENRVPMRNLAVEMINIESELIRRVGLGDAEAHTWAWVVDLPPNRLAVHVGSCVHG